MFLWITDSANCVIYESWEKRIHLGTSQSLLKQGDIFNQHEYKNHTIELFTCSEQCHIPLVPTVFWGIGESERITFFSILLQRCYRCGVIIVFCNSEPIEFDLKVTACIDLEKLLGLPFIRELKSQYLALNETIERTSLRFLWTLGLLIIFHNGMQPFSELWPCWSLFQWVITVLTALYFFMTTLERSHMLASTIAFLCCLWDCRSNLIYIQQIHIFHYLWCLYLEGADNKINFYGGHENEMVSKCEAPAYWCSVDVSWSSFPIPVYIFCRYCQDVERMLGCGDMPSQFLWV